MTERADETRPNLMEEAGRLAIRYADEIWETEAREAIASALAAAEQRGREEAAKIVEDWPIMLSDAAEVTCPQDVFGYVEPRDHAIAAAIRRGEP